MSADFADIAQNINEEFLENTLKNRKVLTVPFSGKCLTCGEAVHERRFCDAPCREEYESNLHRRMFNPSLNP